MRKFVGNQQIPHTSKMMISPSVSIERNLPELSYSKRNYISKINGN